MKLFHSCAGYHSSLNCCLARPYGTHLARGDRSQSVKEKQVGACRRQGGRGLSGALRNRRIDVSVRCFALTKAVVFSRAASEITSQIRLPLLTCLCCLLDWIGAHNCGPGGGGVLANYNDYDRVFKTLRDSLYKSTCVSHEKALTGKNAF